MFTFLFPLSSTTCSLSISQMPGNPVEYHGISENKLLNKTVTTFYSLIVDHKEMIETIILLLKHLQVIIN